MARRKKGNEFSMVNGIRKTKHGTYETAVYVGLSTELDKNGKPKKIYEWIRKDTYAECKAAKIELENEVKNGQYSNLRNVLFSVYADRWVNTISVEPTTRRDYKMYIKKHFNPVFGRFKLKDISEFNIKEYISNKLKGIDGKKGLSSTTVRKHFFVLNMMLRDALKEKNPCKDIEPPKPNKYVPYVPTDEEFMLLRAAVKDTFDEPIILLAGWCGLREGEIFCLKTDDILDDSIRIDESTAISEIESMDTDYEGPKYEYIDKNPKSENGKRTITVPNELMDILKGIVSTIKKAEEKEDKKVINIDEAKSCPKLFDMRPDSYSKRFDKIIKFHNLLFDIRRKFGQAGLDNYLKYHTKNSIQKNIKIQNKRLPDIRFHDLRHYHTTKLYESDIPDKYAAERLGDDVRTLKQVYQHLRLEKKKELDQKVKNLFK